MTLDGRLRAGAFPARGSRVVLLRAFSCIGFILCGHAVYRGSLHMTHWPAVLNGAIVGALVNLPLFLSTYRWNAWGARVLAVVLPFAAIAVGFFVLADQVLLGVVLMLAHLYASHLLFFRRQVAP